MSKKVILLLIVSIFLISFVNAREINCSLDQPFNLWKFNEGNGTTTQESCYGYNATLYGGMNWINGTYGNAVEFNGIDSYIDAGNMFNQNMPEFSFSLWVNVSNLIAYQTMFQSGNYYTAEFVESIQINEGDNDYVLFMSASSSPIMSIDDGRVYNVIGTFNGSDNGNVTLYIDGVPISSVLTYQSQIDATAISLLFGGNYANGFILDGSLDDIAFFNRTLFPDEVREFSIGCNLSNVLVTVTMPSDYPYFDVSSSYLINVHPETTSPIFSVKMNLNGSTYEFSNIGGNNFQIELNITQEGNYPFDIYTYSSCPSFASYSSTFLVRTPHYMTFDLYKGKANETGIWNWFFSNRYKNDFAYITAEYKSKNLDSFTQTYVMPLNQQKNAVFHAPYIDGEAILKLWENTTYSLRLIDGDINFNGVYSIPNVSKSYGINAYLGDFKLESSKTYNLYVSNNTIRPYRTLLNWTLIVLIIFTGIVVVLCATILPTASVIGGIFMLIILGVLRIVLFFWTGN
jgi:hypothetical protein